MDVLFTSVWTEGVMCRISNHSEMVNIFKILIVFSVYWESSACTCVHLELQRCNYVLTFRHHLTVPTSGVHFVGSVCLLLILRHLPVCERLISTEPLLKTLWYCWCLLTMWEGDVVVGLLLKASLNHSPFLFSPLSSGTARGISEKSDSLVNVL
jgi:hypothetical protein